MILNVIRPARFAFAMSISPYFEWLRKYISKKFGVSPRIATILMVVFVNLLGTCLLMALGVGLAGVLSGVPVWAGRWRIKNYYSWQIWFTIWYYNTNNTMQWDWCGKISLYEYIECTTAAASTPFLLTPTTVFWMTLSTMSFSHFCVSSNRPHRALVPSVKGDSIPIVMSESS